MKKIITIIASIAFIFCLLAVGYKCHSQTNDSKFMSSNVGNDVRYTYNDAASLWADSVLSTLSVRERVAQLFIPRLDITNNEAGFRTIEKIVAKEKMGGFLLGKGTISSYIDLINLGQSKADIPLMVTLDGEWGLSMRVVGTPRFPYNVALGAAADKQLLYDYGQEVARECKLMGIQVNFAPVIDVNSNPNNPVIGYRSFGEDPDLVGELSSAYCEGMWVSGVMPVGKHFPGHGDTSSDSHKTLPMLTHGRERIDNIDLRPFVIFFDSDAGVPD